MHVQLLQAVQQPELAKETTPDEVDSPTTQRRTVQDRMSSIAPPRRGAISSPLDEAAQHEDLLDEDEKWVLEQPVSQAKVTRLTEEIRDILFRTMPAFRLFQVAGTLSRVKVFDPACRFGLGMTSFKGPFVEKSSWVEVREREFALPIDEYLLKQFTELLVVRSESAPSLQRDPSSITRFVEESALAILEQGGAADVVVLIEPAAGDVDELFMRIGGWWNAPRLAVRGASVQDVTFVHGSIGGLPVLHIYQAPVDEALVCVVDLTDFELVLMDVAVDKDDP